MIDPIPDNAMSVVEALRRDVPRPAHYPFLYNPDGAEKDEGSLRFRFADRLDTFCPMGLHQKATVSCPIGTSSFPVDNIEFASILAFLTWWDNQTDPAAMDLVWPKA